MQLKFDANQQYQLDAIQAVTELFDGQPRAETELHFCLGAAGFAAVSNRLDLLETDVLANLQRVQERSGISPDPNLEYITVGARRNSPGTPLRAQPAVPLPNGGIPPGLPFELNPPCPYPTAGFFRVIALSGAASPLPRRFLR